MPNLYATFNTPVRFDGDIIITDPCYIIRDRNSEQLVDTLNVVSVIGNGNINFETVQTGF